MSLVVVLGMHRSGTSCLTHMLHRAGLYLGGDILCQSHSDNIGGHWESNEAMAINDQALFHSGGSWDVPPPEIRGNDEIAARMVRFIASLSKQPIGGWKDPRTVLTYPLWRPHLEDYRLVVCLRHPLSVARSLAARRHMDVEAGLQLWAEYNRRLLDHLQSERDTEIGWFDFDAPRAMLLPHVAALCEALGLCADAEVLGTFNEQLRHQSAGNLAVPDELRSLYNTLRARAAVDMEQRAARARALVPSVDDADDRERRLAELIAARQQENQVMQLLDARLRAVERRSGVVPPLKEEVDGLASRVQDLESKLQTLVHHVETLTAENRNLRERLEASAAQCSN